MLSNSSQAVYTGFLSKFCPVAQVQMASTFWSSIKPWVENKTENSRSTVKPYSCWKHVLKLSGVLGALSILIGIWVCLRKQLPITTLPDTKQQGQHLGAVLSQKLGRMVWKTGVWMQVELSLVTSVKPIMVCKALQEPFGTSLSRYYSLTRCNLILFFLLVSLFFLPFS